MKPELFRLEVPDSALADLRERLKRARWPDEPPLEPWSTGTSLAYLKSLAAYWQEGFDWRAWEAKLNAFPQYKARVAGIDLHFIHLPSKKQGAMPLLLSHGWPGSLFEFHKILPLLAEEFTVVAPSLPGYGLSFTPGQKRFGAEDMADCFAELMSLLGYERFGAQGGDWGASIGSLLAVRHAQRMIGLHLNLLMVRRDLNFPVQDEEHRKYEKQLSHFLREEAGYQAIQGTKPQTLAFGLADSPVGLAAWIAEKFRSWSDCDGTIENAISRDELLANVSLYWFTGSIGSSFWPYYARLHGGWPITEGSVKVPTGYAQFPREILSPPRALAAKTYTDIRRWSVMPKGGHFAALEQPEALARDVKAFFSGIK